MNNFAEALSKFLLNSVAQESSVDIAVCSPKLYQIVKEHGIPPSFDDILRHAAKYGWSNVSWPVFRLVFCAKLEHLIQSVLALEKELTQPLINDIHTLKWCIERLWELRIAPSSIQRASELLLDNSSYKTPRKLIFAFSRILGTQEMPTSRPRGVHVYTTTELFKDSSNDLSKLLKNIEPKRLPAPIITPPVSSTIQPTPLNEEHVVVDDTGVGKYVSAPEGSDDDDSEEEEAASSEYIMSLPQITKRKP